MHKIIFGQKNTKLTKINRTNVMKVHILDTIKYKYNIIILRSIEIIAEKYLYIIILCIAQLRNSAPKINGMSVFGRVMRYSVSMIPFVNKIFYLKW